MLNIFIQFNTTNPSKKHQFLHAVSFAKINDNGRQHLASVYPYSQQVLKVDAEHLRWLRTPSKVMRLGGGRSVWTLYTSEATINRAVYVCLIRHRSRPCVLRVVVCLSIPTAPFVDFRRCAFVCQAFKHNLGAAGL